MDSLKLNVVAVDEIHPQLSDLIQALNKSVADTNGKKKIRDWLIVLNQMKASDELTPEQVRQLLFDLERFPVVDLAHMPSFSIHSANKLVIGFILLASVILRRIEL
jgi:hypothetical protein